MNFLEEIQEITRGMFENIPPHVMFPWDYKLVNDSTTQTAGDNDTFEHDEQINLLYKEEDYEDERLSGERRKLISNFDNVFGVFQQYETEKGGLVDLNAEERKLAMHRVAEEQERRRVEQQQQKSLLITKKTVEPIKATWQQRIRFQKLDKNDPNSAELIAMDEANRVIVEGWDNRRRKLDGDSQERQLLAKEGSIVSGSVCLFDAIKGFGFIAPDCGGPDLYFTRNCVLNYNLPPNDAMPELLREMISHTEAILLPGERIICKVRLNDAQSQRRLRAFDIESESGSYAVPTAVLEGKRYSGVIGNYNTDVHKGHVRYKCEASDAPKMLDITKEEDASAESGPLTAAALVQRCHAKGYMDAVFTKAQGWRGQSSASVAALQMAAGTTVTYSLAPMLEYKTGKAIALFCIAKSESLVPGTGTTGDEVETGITITGTKRNRNNAQKPQIQQQAQFLLDEGDGAEW